MRFLPLLLLTFALEGASLPGFRVEPVARIDGFVSSIVTTSTGTIYATTTDGWIHRIDPGETNAQAVRVASLPTHAGSNSGLLGMALADDHTAIVHYTIWGGEDLILDDVIARVDLSSGAETRIHAFACDVEVHVHGASPEHHGGNPTIAPDGSIFVSIGEYGAQTVAQRPGWNGGRVWRIDPSGAPTQWAMGLRNPFDLAWDPELARVVLSDNGPKLGDEINVIAEGDNGGWPLTSGEEPPVDGMLAPGYVFPETVAPTGLARLDGANPTLPRGYLLGAFVTKSLYYFPSVSVNPVPDPIAILSDLDEAIIDVTQSASGDVYLATASFLGSSTVSRLVVPARGDCDGNGLLDWHDMLALHLEMEDGNAHQTVEAQGGSHAGSWGCDANADGVIDSHDAEELRRLLGGRRRSVGR